LCSNTAYLETRNWNLEPGAWSLGNKKLENKKLVIEILLLKTD